MTYLHNIGVPKVCGWVGRNRKKILILFKKIICSPRWHGGKKSAYQCRRCKRLRFGLWVGKIPWSRKWQPTLVFLNGQSHRTEDPGGPIRFLNLVKIITPHIQEAQ